MKHKNKASVQNRKIYWCILIGSALSPLPPHIVPEKVPGPGGKFL